MNIRSIYTRLKIELQRMFDHFWLYTHGLAQLKHSMITKNLFLGGQYSVASIPALKKLGVTVIVNMREEQYITEAAEEQFKVLHLPTPDLHPPTLADLDKGAQFIDVELQKGGSAYVHCRWGEGRGPSMVLAYLMYTGMTFDDGYAFVKKIRPFIHPTADQITRLREYEDLVMSRQKKQ